MEAANRREWLRLLRTRKNLTAQALAELIGVSRMMIHRWESGPERYKPSLDQAAALAKLAGTSVDEVATVFRTAA